MGGGAGFGRLVVLRARAPSAQHSAPTRDTLRPGLTFASLRPPTPAMSTRFPLAVTLLSLALTWGLSLAPAVGQTATSAEDAVAAAEATYARGRPDYILIRRALAAAEATDDLRLKARANFLQARVDSAANRRSKAGPYFRRAERLVAEADSIDFARELAAAEAASAEAAETEAAAVAERDRIAEELASSESAATTTLLTTIAAFVAGIALLVFGFLAVIRGLRGKVKRAQGAQADAEAGFAEARQQMTGAAKASMQRLRNLLRHYRSLIPVGQPGSGTALLNAHEAGLQAMVQSSFDSGDSFETAAESFFDKFRARLVELTAPQGGRLEIDSMPLRLPLDQSIPFTLLFTELVAYGFGAGSTALKAQLTKEGTNVTLTILDASGRQGTPLADAPQLRYARQLAAELGGKLAAVEEEGAATRVRFQALSGRVGGAAAATPVVATTR